MREFVLSVLLVTTGAMGSVRADETPSPAGPSTRPAVVAGLLDEVAFQESLGHSQVPDGLIGSAVGDDADGGASLTGRNRYAACRHHDLWMGDDGFGRR